MSKIIFGGFVALVFVAGLLFAIDVVIGNTTHSDNKDSLDRSSKMAIQESINKGALRVHEEVEINERVVRQAFDENYLGNASFRDKQSKRKFTIDHLQKKPAMIAVRGHAGMDAYFRKLGNEKNPYNESFKKYIVIYEARSEKKQLGGNVK